MAPEPASQATRSPKDRLLDAAEDLFAERDFDDVSVRELAAAAGMNVAAVNYHFQGKENLYHQAILRRFAGQRDRTLAGLQTLLERTEGRPRIEEVIRVVVHEYLDGALSNNFLTLITREMGAARPGTHAHFFKEMVRPVFAAISSGLQAARPTLSQDDLGWFIASIVAQIHHFIMRRIKFESCTEAPDVQAIMLQAFPVLAADRETYISTVTDHITRFSTAAIDGLCPGEDS